MNTCVWTDCSAQLSRESYTIYLLNYIILYEKRTAALERTVSLDWNDGHKRSFSTSSQEFI